MTLKDEFIKQGMVLFRYRGQIPLVLFLLAVPFIWMTDYDAFYPLVLLSLKVLSVVLSVIGFIIRVITIGTTPKGTSGRNREQQVAESLNTRGIYSCVRHPLYLGNYLMWIGITAYTINPLFVLIVTLLFCLYYERIMFAEEDFIRKQFGEEFECWAKNTPAFIPSLKKMKPSEIGFSIKAVLRREYSGMFAAVTAFVFVDVVRDYFNESSFTLNKTYIYCLGVAAVLALLLRSLKHYTTLLADKNRD